MNTKPIRLSNIELLRIISMIMVLCVHFTGATFPLPEKMSLSDITDITTMSKTLMECFSIIGVNCFVLISGYFGIKPSVKGITNFIASCIIYSVSIYSIYIFIKPNIYNYIDLINSFAIFSHTDLWFIPAYFGLYILSPIINKGIHGITKRNFIYILISLTFLNVYLGWFWQGKINPTGYNTMQLIYIYVIGRYLRIFISSDKKHRIKYIYAYITTLLLIFISTFICKSTMAYAYNSPFVILSSIFFFLIFSTFRFKNYYINYVASSAFAVYLIHKMPPIWCTLKDFLYNTSTNINTITFSLYWIVFIFTLFAACISIDKVRMHLMNPIVNFISEKIQRFI